MKKIVVVTVLVAALCASAFAAQDSTLNFYNRQSLMSG